MPCFPSIQQFYAKGCHLCNMVLKPPSEVLIPFFRHIKAPPWGGELLYFPMFLLSHAAHGFGEDCSFSKVEILPKKSKVKDMLWALCVEVWCNKTTRPGGEGLRLILMISFMSKGKFKWISVP